MRKKVFAVVFLLVVLLLVPAFGQERTVFEAHERPPFALETPLLNVYVCDLAGADSILLESGSVTMLVDCGKENQAPQVIAMLNDLGIAHLDYVFNTHPHADHVGGLALLLEEVTVGKFLTVFSPDATGPGLHQRAAMRVLGEHGVPVTQVTQGYEMALGDAGAMVYHQPKAQTVNAQSAMLHVRFGERTILLTGDVEGWTQTRFGERFDLKSDILKFPHHGLNVLNRPFLKSVQPEMAVIPHGTLGSERAQQQLRQQRIPYRFTSWGVIALSTDGTIWRVQQDLPHTYTARAEKHGIPMGVPAQ